MHEAGHAVALRALMPSARLTRVSILPAGHGAAGYNLSVPQERVMLGKRDLENQICVLLAGRAAELLAYGEDALTAGASNDLARAAEIAAAMVAELGMAGEPAVSLKALERCCGGTGGAMDRCRALLGAMYLRAQRVLVENADALARLAGALEAREALSGGEVDEILGALSSESADATESD